MIEEARDIIFTSHSWHAANEVRDFLGDKYTHELWEEIWRDIDECSDCGDFVEKGDLTYLGICESCEMEREEDDF